MSLHISPAPTVWQLGFIAHEQGKHFADNPYEYPTQEWFDWYEGWDTAYIGWTEFLK